MNGRRANVVWAGEPDKRKIGCTVNKAVYDAFGEIAKRRDISNSTLNRVLIEQFVLHPELIDAILPPHNVEADE